MHGKSAANVSLLISFTDVAMLRSPRRRDFQSAGERSRHLGATEPAVAAIHDADNAETQAEVKMT